MQNILVPCIACGKYIENMNVRAFIAQGGQCAACQGEKSLMGKFGSLLIQGVTTQRELAELKREFYSLYKIDEALEARKKEFMQRATEEMNRVIAEVEAQIGQPMKELRARKAQLEAQLKAFMEESKTAEMVVRDLLIELRNQVVNRGNMPQYKNIVEDLRQILKWSEEEMDTFVRAHYSQPVEAPVMTVKPLPPGRRRLKKMGPTATRKTADDEKQEEKPDVHERIEFQEVPGEQFHQALEAAKNGPLQKYTGFLTPHSLEEYATMRCFLNREGTVGYCITADNDLVSVFNASGSRGAGLHAVEDAINKGAETLDAYDGFLPKHYEGQGFEEFDRAKFDPSLANPHWNEQEFGKPDVVFMRRKREQGAPVAAYYLNDLALPRMAYVHDDFLRTGSKYLRVETPESVYILTGSRVKENGLHNMIALQMNTKATLKVADVEQADDSSFHVLVEGKFAYDPNTLRAFLAEKLEGYEITETYYDAPERVAVELKRADMVGNDPMASAMSFFNSMSETLNTLMSLERNRSQAAQALLGQTTAGQMDTPDNQEDLNMKWERANVGGDSFGDGDAADGGLTSPHGNTPLISTH